MRILLSVLSGCIALALPLMALAATPANVTGIATEFADGQVHVRWDALGDSTVASYRVYYSTKSILQNGGLYDDVETTDGAVTQYILQNAPVSGVIYVSVLAVNVTGEESAAFVEEAMLDLSGVAAESSFAMEISSSVSSASSMEADPASSQESSASSLMSPSSATVHLLSAEAISATGVLLTFSDTITVDPALAPAALTIKDGSGTELVIREIVIDLANITVITEVQERGTVYEVQVQDAFHGEEGIPLDATNRTAFFQGHPDGVAPRPSVTEPTVPAVNPATDVSSLHLRAKEQRNGKYTVEATWQYDNSRSDLAMYQVTQSTDGGVTMSQPQTLPMDVGGAQLTDIAPGAFMLVVRTVNIYGQTSAGVSQMVQLPLTTPSTGSSLTRSGPVSLLSLLLISGAGMGWAVSRRKKFA